MASVRRNYYNYFEWLLHGMNDNQWGYRTQEFSKLLNLMFKLRFKAVNHMDVIREEKIDDLRDDFFYDHDEHIKDVPDMPAYPTVLELLISLSYSMEDVMSNQKYGNRTADWFWGMIINLGLEDLDDDEFDEGYAVAVFSRWLKREFAPDGNGSPFPMRDPPCDMTGVDIWRSFLWYVNENYQGRW